MKRRAVPDDDESITSISDVESDVEGVGAGAGAQAPSSEDEVDPDEARVAKARRIVDTIAATMRGRAASDSETDVDAADAAVAAKLQEGVLASRGALFRPVAASWRGTALGLDATRRHRGHKLPATCVALVDDETTAFTGSKDGSIVRWDVETGKKTALPGSALLGKVAMAAGGAPGVGHTDEVLALSVSTNGRYLASGGRDCKVRVWDVRTGEQVEAFQGHTKAVHGLAFRKASNMLYSASADRTIKHWNLDEMAYVETSFGHTSDVHGIDCLYKERAVSVGRDRTARLWKFVDDTHLVFNAVSKTTMSMECVAMLNESWFVAGCQDGSMALYNAGRKKPPAKIKCCHSPSKMVPEPWVVSVASMPNSDIVATGAADGYVRLWQVKLPVAGSRAAVDPVGSVALSGFVNGIQFAPSGRFMVSAVGTEHRMGRWWRLSGGIRNGLAVTPMPPIEAANDTHSSDEDSDDGDSDSE